MKATHLLFGLVAAFIVFDLWLVFRIVQRGRQRSRQADPRASLLALAARAAGDESLGGLVELLATLEAFASEASPVSVTWLVRQTSRDQAPSLLLKITWDGNEWRRVLPLQEAELRLSEWLDAGAHESRSARAMLAEVRSARAQGLP
ncbi:MAG: hypothetical protein VKP62_09090 [Candidatus Sericytochromatia bacterium]|nr:hypothetical protein [Candidatus Sericytochromatia bacterium]